MSLHKHRRSSFKISAMWVMFSHILLVVGLALLCSSRINSHPLKTRCTNEILSTMYSRLTINFLNYFKCFYGIKTGFPAKTYRCTLFNCFFYYNLWHGQNRQVTSHCEYVPHCEWFDLKLGMHGENGLLTNFPKFHGDHATSTMFLQQCRKTYPQTLY